MNSKLSHVMHSMINMTTPHGNPAANIDIDELSWHYSAKTHAIVWVNGK